MVSEKKWKTLKTELKRITQKTALISFDQRIGQLKPFTRDTQGTGLATQMAKVLHLEGTEESGEQSAIGVKSNCIYTSRTA